MANNLSLVILAGGMGSRYKGQKQVDPIGPGKEALMEYSIFDAFSIGIHHFVFIINQEFDLKTKKYFQNIVERNGGSVEFILQTTYTAVSRSIYDTIEHRKKPWGTAHALLIAKSHLSNPFIVINADDFYGRKAFQKAKELVQLELILPNRYGMVAYKLENTLSENGSVSRGICTVTEEFLDYVVERTNIFADEEGVIVYEEESVNHILDGKSPVSMNFWILHPSIFRNLEDKFRTFLKHNANQAKAEFFLPKVINDMIKEDQLEVIVKKSDDNWFGMTYPEDREIVVNSIQNLTDDQKYPNPLWS
ncbi:dTDP-glucose pyrophosphorylase [Empedobacter brevis]|uniref:nucleotidyltransferase family protein n=1 Tax=Empedobacter brevis TaxID=247 RepID=UPI00123D36ED|nr:sugar phosphate nucleotidyltransferase [Empedobacter brevis]QES93390.1 dTDP-glucose pyrophosphorylase [Empedobacter brevis]